VIGAFLTGTDTGCGKTTAGAAIACAARAAGRRVRVLKPVETGCSEQDGELVPADARALAQAAGDERGDAALCPYRLALAAAPAVAAREAGIEIDPGRIRAAFRDACRGADLVLVEGAGGLLVPIAPELDMAGLAAALELPLLVVARSSLGTINHTLLTLASARARGLRVAAVIANDAAAEVSAAERSNFAWLEQALPPTPCFRLPHVHTRDSRELARRLARSVPLDALLAALA
jgi:dethiobiotin synthetase